MASRTSQFRMTSNYLDQALEVPKWIRRMSMNERLNYIVRMYSETCGDNWYLWIETALEGLPRLIVSLAAISKVDVIKEVLEHKYNCGLRQALGTGKKQPRTALQKAKVVFWKIESVRARLFWYWLIAEAVTDYIVEWQSIVVEEQRCNDPPHAGPCILTNPGSTLGSIVASYPLFYLTREYDHSSWSGTGGDPSVIAPGTPGVYNVGSQMTAVWGGTAQISWRPFISDGLGNIVAIGATVTQTANIPTSAACFGRATAFSNGQAVYQSGYEVIAGPGNTLGHCIEGTFSVGIAK